MWWADVVACTVCRECRDTLHSFATQLTSSRARAYTRLLLQALLGQNGAGKSTTMNMLCGLFTPTKGEIRMNGHNIATDEGKAHRREHLGVCPQHDVLWNRLTVWEHLVFFAVIKGMSREDAEVAANNMLDELALSEKRNKYVNPSSHAAAWQS